MPQRSVRQGHQRPAPRRFLWIIRRPGPGPGASSRTPSSFFRSLAGMEQGCGRPVPPRSGVPAAPPRARRSWVVSSPRSEAVRRVGTPGRDHPRRRVRPRTASSVNLVHPSFAAIDAGRPQSVTPSADLAPGPRPRRPGSPTTRRPAGARGVRTRRDGRAHAARPSTLAVTEGAPPRERTCTTSTGLARLAEILVGTGGGHENQRKPIALVGGSISPFLNAGRNECRCASGATTALGRRRGPPRLSPLLLGSPSTTNMAERRMHVADRAHRPSRRASPSRSTSAPAA